VQGGSAAPATVMGVRRPRAMEEPLRDDRGGRNFAAAGGGRGFGGGGW
jgi:hypothetical protein